ncbi:hypothetical protein D4764_02G0002840, partial [Takifugu flavidus]
MTFISKQELRQTRKQSVLQAQGPHKVYGLQAQGRAGVTKGLTGKEADDVAEQTGDEQQRSRGQAEKSKP